MQAVRLYPSPQGTPPYTPSNPAPTSALHQDIIPIPKVLKPGEVLVKMKASTVIRDTLTWPEMYAHEYAIPGNDLSGTVVEVFGPSRFNPGDEVFGMLSADRPGAWAEYVIALEDEIAHKPRTLSWEEAAALPLSAMTAYEALFTHGGVPIPSDEDAVVNRQNPDSSPGRTKNLLVTGAAGAVGVHVVQLAKLSGMHITAATGSNDRNRQFLRDLGAHETIEYAALKTGSHGDRYDVVIDTVGGQILVDVWGCVRGGGRLISVDSSSFNFVEEHAERRIRRDDVEALFFIVKGDRASLDALARFAGLGMLRVFVLDVYPLEKAREAYDRANGRLAGRGKIVLAS
ncbi:hypothetical protein BDW62DRAFT_127576 [Aspergillus aurantiobrunneus]